MAVSLDPCADFPASAICQMYVADYQQKASRANLRCMYDDELSWIHSASPGHLAQCKNWLDGLYKYLLYKPDCDDVTAVHDHTIIIGNQLS